MQHTAIILAVAGGLILTIGDIILKQWVVKSYTMLYIAGLALYFISMNILAYSYKFEDVAVASMMMIIFNIVTLTLVGYFFFNENITLYEISGIALGIFAVMLLEFGKI